MNKLFIILLCGLTSLGLHPTAIDADSIVGNWISPENDLIVLCYRGNSGRYYGKIVWFKVYKGDSEEYDCDIPQKEWLNTVVLSGFRYENKEWNGGEILNLQNCNSYDAYIQMQSPTQLKATGFVFFRWLSESIEFRKYTGELPRQD